MPRGRAFRRHKLDSVKRRVRGYYRTPSKEGVWTDPRRIGRIAQTRTPCSCWMCCNPRRNGELPVQERRANAATSE